MAQQNTNPMTPKPDVRPPAQRVPYIDWELAEALASAGVSAEEAGRAFADAAQQLQQAPKRTPSRVYQGVRPEGEAPNRRVRSPEHCPSCGDILPDGAAFCIACGRSAPATGETRRL